MSPARLLVVYARSPESETLSYQQGWPRHLAADPRFDCVLLNVLDPRTARAFIVRSRLRARRFDAVVVLHSVFSNARYLHGRLLEALRRVRAPKVYFIGNEYKLMPEKMAFCEELGVSLLVSQITSPDVHALYGARLGCEVVGIPNTGLDTALFSPRRPFDERPIDLGYRAFESPPYLGHVERTQIVEVFRDAAARHRLVTDISMDPEDRFTEPAWADFLNRCKGQVGSEAGGDYFELTDATRKAVIDFQAERPDAPFEVIWDSFFRDYPDPVSGRALSGRVVEAAGAKTVQLLLEGDYGGYFHADIHYISVRKDFSNVDEALEKLNDPGTCREVADAAHRVALEELTWPRLIDRFCKALTPLLAHRRAFRSKTADTASAGSRATPSRR